MSNFPSWLDENLNQLVQQYKQSRLPHGLLVIGKPGNGSQLFMNELVDLLLCLHPTDRACGTCKSCQLSKSGHHPDFLKVEPEGKSLTIKVDSIRAITNKLSETAQQSGNKVVYIKSAQKMNTNAANALLKVLEEPTAKTFLLLESSELSQTLPTIRSRCRLVQLSSPNVEQSLAYLSENGCRNDATTALSIASLRPLDALTLDENAIENWYSREAPFMGASSFTELSVFIAKQDLNELLNQILMWLDSAIRSKKEMQIVLAPVSEALLKSLASLENVSLFRFRDYIVGKMAAINRQANLNSQLMAEELASRWAELRGTQ
jgi:DNA polymerase-3 subunit delta'